MVMGAVADLYAAFFVMLKAMEIKIYNSTFQFQSIVPGISTQIMKVCTTH